MALGGNLASSHGAGDGGLVDALSGADGVDDFASVTGAPTTELVFVDLYLRDTVLAAFAAASEGADDDDALEFGLVPRDVVPGDLVALDARTGAIVWRAPWPTDFDPQRAYGCLGDDLYHCHYPHSYISQSVTPAIASCAAAAAHGDVAAAAALTGADARDDVGRRADRRVPHAHPRGRSHRRMQHDMHECRGHEATGGWGDSAHVPARIRAPGEWLRAATAGGATR